MGIRSFFSGLFGRGTKNKPMTRSYMELASVGGTNSDWMNRNQSQDSSVWQTNAILRQRMRDLFDGTAFFRKYKEQLIANIFGDEGIRLRMRAKEETDRVVYVGEEKAAHENYVERIARIEKWMARKTGRKERKFRRHYIRAKATIKAGALDLYANQLIEREWKEWQKSQYATVTGRYTYSEVRHLRILAAARDGDFFIRMVRNPSVNKYGFSLQLIHSEWCDFNLNRVRSNGQNEIRMGVELNEWGKPIAYHFIKRSPGDWQYQPPGAYFMGAGERHERIPAEEIIHYARFDYADNTRPAAWCVAAIPVARNLSKYIEAAVIAARAGACQSGFLYSDIMPEGGGLDPSQLPNPCDLATGMQMAPGSVTGLPYGVKYMANNPNNPNSQFGDFRKNNYRELAACAPGGNYNILANDAEGVSYSTGRIFSLDDREIYKVLQRFDIDKAERPIFEAWLEMALSTGAIPLPLAKLNKYKAAHFAGRRWDWVDPAKDAKALETELATFVTSWTRIFDDRGEDLEEVWIERAEEMMLAEQLGLTLPTFQDAPAAPMEEAEEPEEPEEDDEEEDDMAEKSMNGHRRNGVPSHN